MAWGAGASTGIVLIDLLFKPFIKMALKCPLACVAMLMVVYGFVGYHVIKSTFLSDHQ